MNNIDSTIGINLSRARKVVGFTQKSFGGACTPPITSQQVSKYELGTDSASGTRLCDFARVLNCRVVDFFVGLDNEDEPLDRGKRGAYELMSDYQALPERLQASVRGLIHTLAKEIHQ